MQQWIAPQPPCQLSPDVSQDELVDHLNRNVTQLIAWRSTNVDIQAHGVPVRLSAILAVESPRNFRLVAKTISGNEADFGSNTERFWFWMRRSEPKHVFTALHDEWDAVGANVPIPFQPDWLMEVLGVIPIDATQVTLERNPNDPKTVSLVSQRQTPDGRRVRRVMRIETCYGHIVAHELYDEAGTLIGRADLSDYQTDPDTKAELPHKIHLEWPQAQLDMTLHIGSIEVNPTNLPDRMWQMPDIPGYPTLDLARMSRSRQPERWARKPAHRQ